MAYTKTNWQNGVTPINETNLNKIENELETLDADVTTLNSEVDTLDINKVNKSAIKNEQSSSTEEIYSANYINGLNTFSWKNATKNNTYINSGNIKYLEIGNLVIVSISDVQMKADAGNGITIASGFPAETSDIFVGFQTSQNTLSQPVRLRINNGNLQPYYSTAKYYSDTNIRLYGTIFYVKS